MDINQAQKLLRSGNRGRFTLYCRVVNAYVNGPEAISGDSHVDVYLFPGTQLPNGAYGAWMPKAKQVTFVHLEHCEPVKKTKAMLSHLTKVDEVITEMNEQNAVIDDYLGAIAEKNPMLAMAVSGFMQGIENDANLDDAMYENAKLLFDEIEKAIGEHEMTDKFREAATKYHAHSKDREQILENIAAVQHDRESAPTSITADEAEQMREKVAEDLGEETMEDLRTFTHMKVLLCALFQGDKLNYTYEEACAQLKAYRPEFNDMPDEVIEQGVKNGFHTAIEGYTPKSAQFTKLEGGLVVYDELTQSYELTDEGRSFAIQMMKANMATDQAVGE